jgi:hypothetical protein
MFVRFDPIILKVCVSIARIKVVKTANSVTPIFDNAVKPVFVVKFKTAIFDKIVQKIVPWHYPIIKVLVLSKAINAPTSYQN